MARGIGATRGVATTDQILTEYAANDPIWTIAFWAFRNGSGGGGVGEIIDKRTVSAENRHIYLGARDTAEEAFELYKNAAVRYYGEFARFE